MKLRDKTEKKKKRNDEPQRKNVLIVNKIDKKMKNTNKNKNT